MYRQFDTTTLECRDQLSFKELAARQAIQKIEDADWQSENGFALSLRVIEDTSLEGLLGLAKKGDPAAEYLVSHVSSASRTAKKLKMLKRHLMTHYQMTPEDYRAKWKLPADYPMVAPRYAERRKELALKIGLGRKAAAPAKAAPKAASKKLSGAAALAEVRGQSAE